MCKRKRTGTEFLIILACILVFSAGVFARSIPYEPYPHTGKFGLGITVPAGITVKYWINPENAFDLKSSWETNDGQTRICLDYLWHRSDLLPKLNQQITNIFIYYGLGVKFSVKEKKDTAGLRIPFGISYIARTVPFDFFFELAPTLQISPETNLEINPYFGIRYLFH